MSEKIYFDDSLAKFAGLVVEHWGVAVLENNVFLRDVTGKLTFVVTDGDYGVEARVELGAKAAELLPHYVDNQEFAVSTPEELFDPTLKNKRLMRRIAVSVGGQSIWVNVIDRRMVGADWLRQPVYFSKPPKRIVFASIKGGVGRSTALCVAAAHLASRGKRVLAIDMDIEAPGLGNMLLPAGTLPEFGLLDYLVERNLAEIDDQFFVDMVGPSWLGGGRGRVDVIPAIGQKSLDNPGNVLAKIARAYLPGESLAGVNDGTPSTFMDHIGTLVEHFSDPLRYDVILVDARAGLHETTAAAVVGLGGNVLFFGIDQPQTLAGYELLLAHLSTLPIESGEDWRELFSFVQAKAPVSAQAREEFRDQIDGLVKRYLRPNKNLTSDSVDVGELSETFDLEWDERNVEIPSIEDNDSDTLAILDSDRYRAFDPMRDRDSLADSAYGETFRMLLEKIEQLLEEVAENEAYVDD